MGQKKPPDSVFKEAWENLCEDFSKILPASVAGKLGRRRWGWKTVALLTLLELVVLAVVGKLIYDWLTG